MRELYLTKNDKERVRAECRGLVPIFSNNGPSGDGVEGQTDGPSGSQSQPSGIDSNKKKTNKGGKPVVETLKCPWLLHCVKPKGENTWTTIAITRRSQATVMQVSIKNSKASLSILFIRNHRVANVRRLTVKKE
ncbi:hypothetical protein Tco_0910761 [Tanacetum coccineum]|uniref:Uncharacterized protein n=1 Tax=Tanacetum coccineum TaxID=301880 RepID=A0ABQ5CTT8_9ASTR